MKQPSLTDQVLTVLKKEGYSDEQLAEFTADLMKMGFEKLYLQAVGSFTDADLDLIDQAQKFEVEGVIRKIYRERTGRDPQKEVAEIVNVFCAGFLKEYHQQTSNK